MAKARAHILITGRVQGVYFRSSARAEAERNGLLGWVKNTKVGSVEIVAEGEKEDIEGLIAWCRVGSPSSKVAEVKVNWEEYTSEFHGFKVEYSGY